MWDKLLGSWIEKHLGTYFKNLDARKFLVDLSHGDVKLGPLELRPEAFLHSENAIEFKAVRRAPPHTLMRTRNHRRAHRRATSARCASASRA